MKTVTYVTVVVLLIGFFLACAGCAQNGRLVRTRSEPVELAAGYTVTTTDQIRQLAITSSPARPQRGQPDYDCEQMAYTTVYGDSLLFHVVDSLPPYLVVECADSLGAPPMIRYGADTGWVQQVDLFRSATPVGPSYEGRLFAKYDSLAVCLYSSRAALRAICCVLTVWQQTSDGWRLSAMAKEAIGTGLYMNPVIDSTYRSGDSLMVRLSSIGADGGERWGSYALWSYCCGKLALMKEWNIDREPYIPEDTIETSRHRY